MPNFDDEKLKQGFVRFWRSFVEWEWFTDVNTCHLFQYCILRANYSDNEWRGIKIKRGSFLTSRENLAISTGLTIQQIRTAIKKLKSTNELTIKTTNQYSIITVNNYDLYQQVTNELTNELTNEQPTNNQRVTTNNKEIINNNNNNNNNELINNYCYRDKNKNKNFIIPLIEEIQNYCIERKNNISAEQFYDYYSSKGWMIGRNKMKDWKAAVRTWERNQKKENSNENKEKKGEYSYGY